MLQSQQSNFSSNCNINQITGGGSAVRSHTTTTGGGSAARSHATTTTTRFELCIDESSASTPSPPNSSPAPPPARHRRKSRASAASAAMLSARRNNRRSQQSVANTAAVSSDNFYESDEDSFQNSAKSSTTHLTSRNVVEPNDDVFVKTQTADFSDQQPSRQQQRNPVLRRQNTFSLPSSSARAATTAANRPVSAEFTTPQHERRRFRNYNRPNTAVTSSRKDSSMERRRTMPLTSPTGGVRGARPRATTPTASRRQRRPVSDITSSRPLTAGTSNDDFRRNSHSSCHHSKDGSSTPVYSTVGSSSRGTNGRRTTSGASGSAANVSSGGSSRRV